jgi:predicted component of type VI protein secretion system
MPVDPKLPDAAPIEELTSMREFRKQTLQAGERYRLMLQEYPELVRRVPDNQLAAWLGVASATFSRLKHSDPSG